MKRFINTCILLLAVSLLPAQGVTTKFSGITTDGHYCLLDSVRVENLTRGWSTVLDCFADTSFRVSVQTGPTTGIDNIQASSVGDGISLSNYVNHVMFHSFALNVSTSGPVSIDVWDVLGRKVLSVQEMLSEGTYQYQVHLDHPAAFFLSARTPSGIASLKLLNMTNAGRNDICSESFAAAPLLLPRRISSQLTSSEYESAVGDQMRYTGYMYRQGQVESSDPQVVSQEDADTQITLHFASAQYSHEGIYVGLMGFNSQLYSYPFKLITSSNLSTFNSFVNGLNTANGTILYHAVYNALDSISRAPIPSKLSNVTLVTFTDGLDVGSWRMNRNFSTEAAYLQAVNTKIYRTYINGIALTSYSIGIKGNDVSDETRFYNDLQQLATIPENVYSVVDMSEVNRKFRDIAASVYQLNRTSAVTITLPGSEPGSRIRLTFDAVSDASQSAYYLEGDYDFEDCGVLNNVQYSGVRCSNGSTLVSVPDGLFDIFTINNLENNLGEQVSLANIQQWYYVHGTGQWQLNSEFTPEGNTTTTEDRSSALVMLVLDCSSSLGDNFSSMKDAAKEFLKILAGNANEFSAPLVESLSPELGALNAICKGRVANDNGLTIIDCGICISENANMDNAAYYSAEINNGDFECVIGNLVEGKTYYYHAFAKNAAGISYGGVKQFTAINYNIPSVVTRSVTTSYTSATLNGEVVASGNQDVIERGFCYGKYPMPTIDSTSVVVGSGLGKFNKNIQNLQDFTTYYVRAYAVNSVGVAYGNQVQFKTKQIVNISLSSSVDTIRVGETLQLQAILSPEDAEDPSVTWSSSSTSVATVSQSGLVTGIAGGSATIRATSSSGALATCKVVVKIDANRIELDKHMIYLEPDASVSLSASVFPTNTTDKTVTWTVSDPNVIKYNKGYISRVGDGRAVIYATTSNGITDSCVVQVLKKIYVSYNHTFSPSLPKDGHSLTTNRQHTDLDNGFTFIQSNIYHLTDYSGNSSNLNAIVFHKNSQLYNVNPLDNIYRVALHFNSNTSTSSLPCIAEFKVCVGTSQCPSDNTNYASMPSPGSSQLWTTTELGKNYFCIYCSSLSYAYLGGISIFYY